MQSIRNPRTFTVYLDDIKTMVPALPGDAPLTIQFKDLSTKMEDTAHTSWAWDFHNDGSTDSTERNPLYIYTEDGTYTVKLTATNAGGSDSEIKTGYITVGTVTSPPVATFWQILHQGRNPSPFSSMTRPPTLPHRGDGLTRTLLSGGRSLPQPGTPRIPSQQVPMISISLPQMQPGVMMR